jgi:putative transposase
MEDRKKLIGMITTDLSVSSQCKLLEVCRSSIYYVSVRKESDLNLTLMRLMDEMYLEHPEFGAERMHVWLRKDKHFEVNLKRVSRLYYEVMGLHSLQPGPHTSTGNKQNKKYPYLLKNMAISRANQVWMTDITYLPMTKGFVYMMAIIDVYSRAILHWSISNTMDSNWCCDTIRQCIEDNGIPEIINTDQGSQFTSDDFIYEVINNGIKMSMDGKGRAKDNIYIERFWRTLKYEHIYIRPTLDVGSLYKGIEWYINWYNYERRHESINHESPMYFYKKHILLKTA